MAKKDMSKMTADDLRKELASEQEKSDRLQREKEERDEADEKRKNEEKAREERTRADASAARSSEPTEEQWGKLEAEYGMERDDIKKQWRFIQRAMAPLQAELGTYKARDAASEAVRVAKDTAKANDPQFPKYEAYVDEYLNDQPLGDKADPEKLKKHMDRAVHYARGKARATDKNFRDEEPEIREAGLTDEQKEDASSGFGEFQIAGMPLTIVNEKLVPNDFRKRHQHPEQKEGVRMNERERWKEGVPVKPRAAV